MYDRLVGMALHHRLSMKLVCLHLESMSLNIMNLSFHIQRLAFCLLDAIRLAMDHIQTSFSGGPFIWYCSISLVETVPRSES